MARVERPPVKKSDEEPLKEAAHVSILDVARAAGVSASTVSRVLNGTAVVSPDARKSVETAIAELHFEPNRFARSLVTRRSGIVGILLDRSVKYATTNIMIQLEEVASSLGYIPVVLTIDKPFSNGLARVFSQFWAMSVEGIIVIAPRIGLSEEVRRVRSSVPIVILSSQLQDIGLPMIGEDQYVGAKKAVQYLLEMGHRSIWYVAGSQDWFDEQRRREGWHDALEEAGLLSAGQVVQSTWSPHSAYEGMVKADLSAAPDAIFVASDHMAMAVISALAARGLRVPADVSIVGYDDAEASAYTLPALTTVQQNLALVARRAMGMLIRQIRHEKVSMVTPMEPDLIIRESVAELRLAGDSE